MRKDNQNKSQQNVTSPPPSPVVDDDFAIPELTVKDASGESQKVKLTVAASPAPLPSPSSDGSDDKQKKLDAFRDKANGLMANDLGDQAVLADLEARAKADDSAKVLDSKKELLEEGKPDITVAPIAAIEKTVVKEKSEEEEMFISLGDLQERIAEFKVPASDNKVDTKEELPELKKKNELVEEEDDEPVLANPVMQTVPVAAAPVETKAQSEELVPEIDLDAEDLFAEENKKETASKDSLEKVEIKSKQELARGQKQRTAVVHNIMKTETIYDRSKKPEKAKRGISGSKKDDYKTLAPIEELEVLSLEEWRRLGDIPEERMAKIKEKIELLGEKGILSQIKGLNAWRSSPVMQHYLDLGIQALLDKKGVEEYMETVDDDTNLTYQEWMAINKLNGQLMI